MGDAVVCPHFQITNETVWSTNTHVPPSRLLLVIESGGNHVPPPPPQTKQPSN